MNTVQKCIIINEFREEYSLGSSPDIQTHVFTDKKLADTFIKKWNEFDPTIYERREENRYCDRNYKWYYWLEVEDGIINERQK